MPLHTTTIRDSRSPSSAAGVIELSAPHHHHEQEQHALLDAPLRLQQHGIGLESSEADETSILSWKFHTNRQRILLLLGIILLALTVITLQSGDDEDTRVVHATTAKKQELVDVNGPPDASFGNETSHSSVLLFQSDEDNNKPLLVVDYSHDEQIPSSSGKHWAADALECRESVIQFVINATDAKDECDGLKRAFDKTCNSDEQSDKAEDTSTEHQRRLTVAARRRPQQLFQHTNTLRGIRRGLQILYYQTHERLRYALHLFYPSFAFFAEDEVMGEAYDNARYLVDNRLDRHVHLELQRRLAIHKKCRQLEDDRTDELSENNRLVSLQQDEEYMGEDDEASRNQTELQNATRPPVRTREPKPKQSLTVPTSNQHMSGQMLSETLLLSQKEGSLQQAILHATNASATSNVGNKTLTDAEVDALASKKAVQDTTAAVSAMLNDPTSVEARTCCASILNVYHENCDSPEEEVVSDRKLFLVVFVIALCGMVKSVIRYYSIRWLPEAAGCILVGVVCGIVMSSIPSYDISFDGNWFLRIMVPPIVFEAALSIDKRSFNRHVVPIMIYAVAGTLFATGLTAYILHKGSLFGSCETIPYVESLTFGALISSIDPIAVLSVLSNMGMTDTDTIYVVIFGESLLNDGVALVLFQTLVHFLDESLVIDNEAVTEATIHFLVVAIGSLCVGIGSGFACTAYYWLMQGCQTPLVEVLLFFCWAFIPYYICDGIGWSGIVAVVATGFVMDWYVVGQLESSPEEILLNRQPSRDHDTTDARALCRRSFFTISGHLSQLAKTHVHFVAELLATMMETAIFAYLGLFLFSYRYHWNFLHTFLAISACLVSRAIMIPLLSLVANWVTRLQQTRVACQKQHRHRGSPPATGVVVDGKMQLVLWVAGLRGAMSFALVENIPLYDTVTQQGSRLKPELKAMTSASIVFTVFVLGGYTYYLMEYLGLNPQMRHGNGEMTSLVKRGSNDRVAMLSASDSAEEATDRSSVRHRPKEINRYLSGRSRNGD